MGKSKQDKQQKLASNYQPSPQDRAFLNHVSYLVQLSNINLKLNEPELSSDYLKFIKRLTNKKPIKLNPELKYFHCKNCDLMLTPGVTCKIRVKSKRSKHVVSTCMACGCIKRYNFK